MGRAVEALALRRGHTTGAVVDNEADWQAQAAALQRCNVAIEFSTPATAVGNIRRCLAAGLPVVAGTTGWYDSLDAMVAECKAQDGALFVASNFSIGMNVMFELNRRLAQLMNGRDGYEVSISETHHIHKIDAPSGTAITLAEEVAACMEGKEGWQLLEVTRTDPETGRRTKETLVPKADPHKVGIVSFRQGEEAGTHEVTYDSEADTLTLRHSAKNRNGLAMGALLAAEFLCGKQGYFTMKDLLSR